MIERVKVIEELEECMELLDCIGTREQCKKYVSDALTLLKEQEAMKKNRLPYSPDSNVQWTYDGR